MTCISILFAMPSIPLSISSAYIYDLLPQLSRIRIPLRDFWSTGPWNRPKICLGSQLFRNFWRYSIPAPRFWILPDVVGVTVLPASGPVLDTT
jgi:ABC-type sulfate transport system permease subunit